MHRQPCVCKTKDFSGLDRAYVNVWITVLDFDMSTVAITFWSPRINGLFPDRRTPRRLRAYLFPVEIPFGHGRSGSIVLRSPSFSSASWCFPTAFSHLTYTASNCIITFYGRNVRRTSSFMAIIVWHGASRWIFFVAYENVACVSQKTRVVEVHLVNIMRRTRIIFFPECETSFITTVIIILVAGHKVLRARNSILS